MTKKKSATKTFIQTGVGLTTSSVMVGLIPTSGNATAQTMKLRTMQGIGKAGSTALPVMGTAAGLELMSKPLRKLKKAV